MLLRGIRSRFNQSKDIFGLTPAGGELDYKNLFEKAKSVSHEDVDTWVSATGPDIQADFLEELALNTQVVIKKSPPNWQHGRILYTKVRSYLQSRRPSDRHLPVTVLETGTARGFSAICLSKGLIDEQAQGLVFSIDTIPHNYAMYWNCISDVSGKQTREALLNRWEDEKRRLVFLSGKTKKVLNHLHLPRVNFAFLDAQHTYSAVLDEFGYVRSKQIAGDVVVFDDVTEGVFDGVISAVRQIENEGEYKIEYLGSKSRGYAIATKN